MCVYIYIYIYSGTGNSSFGFPTAGGGHLLSETCF